MIYIIMTQPWFTGDKEELVTAFDNFDKMMSFATFYHEQNKILSKFDYFGLNFYKVKPGGVPEQIGSMEKEID